ncbi:signal recognition particle-docking protein FtsY [Rheinheimera riviphila]|uniref:Signal recognition particle receptor FtsY n=1 Tax=Rheinheimera riviphila TaxID=1834037 RepID=A0A437R0I4_9GAMM|nr:signal recognition particle-docking protein FtsY [Rheinheimera riviphila]RVU40284.1 signal recognition particle-docking protein FtsY [Rheinheimera riviphila]
MTKPNKLFSWLGFGKKPEADPIPTAVATPEPAAEIIPTEVATPEVANVEVSIAAPEAVPLVTPVETEIPASSSPEPIAELAHQIIPAPTPELIPQPISEPIPEPVPAPIIETAPAPAPAQAQAPAPAPTPTQPAEPIADKKPGFFARLKQGLSKTSQNLGNGLASLFLGKKIDDDLYEELETQLLMADVGVDTSQKLIKQLVQHADRRQLKDADSLYEKLQQEMASLLDDVEKPLDTSNGDGPFVILMVGVNGVGKTTTIGKMAQQFKLQGKSVMLAAGDTFRAAAVEQLQVWGDRNQIPVIAQHSGADSASVIFDAYQAAKARKIDVLIADTAGRLQNKAHLMEELKKIVRVMKKIDGAAPHEVMLTLDAGTGQNAISQAKLFHEAVELTGISLTKLDGTAKGGVIFAIADQFKLPIRYIGVGESIDDLRVFNSKDFIRALFNKEF